MTNVEITLICAVMAASYSLAASVPLPSRMKRRWRLLSAATRSRRNNRTLAYFESKQKAGDPVHPVLVNPGAVAYVIGLAE